jgi:ribosomal-protein-alanine N-acetyltransferase
VTVHEVRPAEPEDEPAIVALEQASFGTDAWSEALLRDGLSGSIPGALYLVAETSGSDVVGYAVASLFADVAELQRIAVTATHRRTGVAGALLARVEQEAVQRHAERLLLEVREDNTAALAFYAAHGFSEVARRARYYGDGTTAIVLARGLGTMDE